MLSLPASRITIVIAKIITAAYLLAALILLVFFLMLGIGAILQLPGMVGSHNPERLGAVIRHRRVNNNTLYPVCLCGQSYPQLPAGRRVHFPGFNFRAGYQPAR
jgi:hypothetical protein